MGWFEWTSRRLNGPDVRAAAILSQLVTSATPSGRKLSERFLTTALPSHRLPIRAIFLAQNPKLALLELQAEPLRRLALLENSGVSSGRRYQKLRAECDAAIARVPAVAKHKLVPFEQMVPKGNNERAKLYAKHYRIASINTHGTVLSIASSVKIADDGSLEAPFDSRMPAWELVDLFGTLSNYALSYCNFVAEIFDFEASPAVADLIVANRQMDLLLIPDARRNLDGNSP